jgi:predicted metal-dependent phosphoesterase TrpH
VIQADLHIHTTFSNDSSITPKTLVEQLVKHSFIKVAAVTDHDTTRGIGVTRQLAQAYPDILIIPGVEISTPQGDVLVLGTEDMPPEPWTVESIVDFARENEYLSVVAHPFREYGMGDLSRNYKLDAIEILNGASSPAANKAAQELAKQMGLPGVGGSDAHQPEEVCGVYTQVDAAMNVDDILAAVKKGRVSVPPMGKSIRF